MTQHTQPVVAAQHQQHQQHQPPASTPQQQHATTTTNSNNNNASNIISTTATTNNNQTQTVAVQHPSNSNNSNANNNNGYQSQQQNAAGGGQMFNSQLQPTNVYVPTHGMPGHHHPQHHHQPGAMYQAMIPTAIPSNVYVNNVTANVNLHGWAQPVPHGTWVHPSGAPQYIHGDLPPEHNVPVLQPMPVTLPAPNALTGQVMNHNAAVITGGPRGSRRGRGRGGSSSSRRGDYSMQRHPQQEGSPAPTQSGQNNQQEMQQGQQTEAQQMMTALPASYVPHPQYAAHAPQYPYSYPTFLATQPHVIHPGQSAAAQQATGTPLYFSAMPLYNGPHMYNYACYLPNVINQSEYQYGEEVAVGDERQTGSEGGAMIWHQQPIYSDEYGMSPADMHAVASDDLNHNPSSICSANDTPSMLSPNYPPMYEQMAHQMGVMQIYDDPHMGQMHVIHPEPGVQQLEEELSECGSQPTAPMQMVPRLQMVPAPPMTLQAAATGDQILHQQPTHLIPVTVADTIMQIDDSVTTNTTSQHHIAQRGDNAIDSNLHTYENVSNVQPGESVTSLNEETVQLPADNLEREYQQQPQQQQLQQIPSQNILLEAVQSDDYNSQNKTNISMTDVQELQESSARPYKVNVASATSTDVVVEPATTTPNLNKQQTTTNYQQQQQQQQQPQHKQSQEKQYKQPQEFAAKQHQQQQTQTMPQQHQQSMPTTQQSQQQTHYHASTQHQHHQQQQSHQQPYENRKSSQMYNQQHQSRNRKYEYHHSHSHSSSTSNNDNSSQQQQSQQTTKTMSWTNSSQHKKSTTSVAVTATPTTSHTSGSYNKHSNSSNSSSSHAHGTRTYTNQQHHNYQQQQNYNYQQQQQHQPQTRNYGAMKMPSSPISSAPNTMERKTSQSSDKGQVQTQPQQQQQQKQQQHSSQPQTTSTASTTAAPYQFQQQQTQQTATNDALHLQPSSERTTTAAGASTTIPSKQQSQHYSSGFSTKKHSSSTQGYGGTTSTANVAATATNTNNAVDAPATPATPAINLAPPVSNTAPPVPSTPSWASLFSSNSSATTTANANIAVSASNLSVIAASSTPTASYSKKPVAKVAPYEGLTPVSPPPPVVTPGTLSYSAASAQNLIPPSSTASTTTTAAKKSNSNENQMQRTSLANVDEYSLKFADFLTKYKSDWSTVSLRPRGLTNRSNYCYINSILQALLGCSPLYNLIKSIPKQAANLCEVKTPTINAMITFMLNFSTLPSGLRLRNTKGGKGNKDELGGDLQCDSAFEPTEIYKLWNDSREEHVEGRQEDAEEFLSYILNKLNDEMLEVIKIIAKPNSQPNGQNEPSEEDGDVWQMICNNRNKGSVTRQTDFGCTPLSDIFRGELRSRLQREGEHSTDVIQPFFTLQLNIEKAASVKEALEILVGRDQLEGVTGSKTKQEVVAWQQMNLEKLPPILILHLKWFDYRSDGCTKILKKVEFPVELKIDATSKKYSQKQRAYRLFAVVYHDGKEATKGHYVTDVYHTGYGSWLRYDDSSVKPVSENHVLLPRTPRVPYLLCYRRCDTIPQQSNNNQNNSATGNNNSSGNTQSSTGK